MLNIHWFTYLYNIFFNLSISSNAFDQPEEPRIGQMWKKQHWKKPSVAGWWDGCVQWSVGLHPLLCHPSSTVCESLLWPRQCEFDECSTSALLNRWDSVCEAPSASSNDHCSTPLTRNHTNTAEHHREGTHRRAYLFILCVSAYSALMWRQRLDGYTRMYKYVSAHGEQQLPSSNIITPTWHRLHFARTSFQITAMTWCSWVIFGYFIV